MNVAANILSILDGCRVDGNNMLFLPAGQLDRPTYAAVNKVLEALGGKWNRPAKGHIYERSPVDMLEEVIRTGTLVDPKKAFQFFETPPEITRWMITMADIHPTDHQVLEPSAGRGAIARELLKISAEVWLIELDPRNVAVLRDEVGESATIIEADFLNFDVERDGRFDRIVMNPPFSRQQDIAHILQAWECLAPEGVLVSIVSESPFVRTDARSVNFMKWLKDVDAETVPLEAGAFKASGTMVNARIVKIVKPANGETA